MEEEHTEILVMGSGAAGMTAALAAAKAGRKVTLLEKAGTFGGTTAISGGGIWIPDSPQARAAGIEDKLARDYVLGVVGNRANPALIDAYLTEGPRSIEWLAGNSSVSFLLSPPSSDWYPDVPGSADHGRLLAPEEFDGKELGADFDRLSRPRAEFNAPGGMMIDLFDLPYIARLPAPGALWYMAKIAIRFARDKRRFGRGTRLTMGTALAGRLLKSALDAGVTMIENAAVERLILEGGRVVGVQSTIAGRPTRLLATSGVILASGGFSANAELRKAYIPFAEQHVSILPYTNTGDGMTAAQGAGAAIGQDNACNAVWAVVSKRLRADAYLERYAHLIDMSKPGCIAVGKDGRRFANEASVHFVEAMHESGNVPAHIVADARFVKRYGMGLSLPGGSKIKELVADGYLKSGATLADLARKIGVDPSGLEDSVRRNNGYAKDGKDPEFGKGDKRIDREIGDPKHVPNPCLGKIGDGPYYAIEIFPGDGSTTIGVKTDAQMRALDEYGQPIPGLWAAGLDANSIWEGKSPAHGCNVGPALVNGYIAGRSAAGAELPNRHRGN